MAEGIAGKDRAIDGTLPFRRVARVVTFQHPDVSMSVDSAARLLPPRLVAETKRESSRPTALKRAARVPYSQSAAARRVRHPNAHGNTIPTQGLPGTERLPSGPR